MIDDFLCEQQSDEFITEDDLDDNEHMGIAMRRKQAWKHARRRMEIRAFRDYETTDKPLHYYASNPPWDGYATAPNKTNNKTKHTISKNYKSSRNWDVKDKRQIDELADQLYNDSW